MLGDRSGSPWRESRHGNENAPDHQPGPGRPAGFNQPGFDRPGFNQPGFDRPGFNQAGFDQPGFDQAGFDQAGFHQPGFEQGFQQPGFDQPAAGPSFAPSDPNGSLGSAGHQPDLKVAGAPFSEPAASPAPPAPHLGTALMDPVPPRDQIGDEDWREPMEPRGPFGPPPRRQVRRRSTPSLKIAALGVAAVVLIAGAAVAAVTLTGGSGDASTKATVSPKLNADASRPSPDARVLAKQREVDSYVRAGKAARKDAVDGPALLPKGKPPPTKRPKSSTGDSGGGGGVTPTGPVSPGTARAIGRGMLPQWSWSIGAQWGCADRLFARESGWRWNAANPSGAYGIPQALPGSKMSAAGADWRTNPRTQIEWGYDYIKGRYGTPCKAWNHSESVGWY